MTTSGQLRRLLDQFLEASVFESGLADKSLEAYQGDLGVYVEHLEQGGIVLCDRYGLDTRFYSLTVTTSTLLSLATLPLWLYGLRGLA